jgi:rhamnopyranosyl-N-acetylglucosaminyl-diphospho-decaprenol beta-1,3/1,4-galactofuranosyltransferase
MNNIVSIIVTYNRPLLLKKVIEGVLKQNNIVSDILIIDNSLDNKTHSILVENRFLENNKLKKDILYKKNLINPFNNSLYTFCYFKTSENIGGAGGYSTGVKIAYMSNYKFFWLLDDDGYPDTNCLFELFKNIEGKEFFMIEPLVLNSENNNEIAFSYKKKDGHYLKYLQEIYNEKDIILDFQNTLSFNGLFFDRKIVEKIGYPLESFFFIKDDTEYYYRGLTSGCFVKMIKDAVYYHPVAKSDFVKYSVLKFSFSVYKPSNSAKIYFFFRNGFVINLKYFGILYSVKRFFIDLFKYILSFNFREVFIYLVAIKDGLLKRFNNKEWVEKK